MIFRIIGFKSIYQIDTSMYRYVPALRAFIFVLALYCSISYTYDVYVKLIHFVKKCIETVNDQGKVLQ